MLLRRQRGEATRGESKSEQSHKAMSGALNRRSNTDNRKSRKPLFGKRIVITRAPSQAGELARRIEELEGEVIYCPAIEIEPPENFDALDRAIELIQDRKSVV